MDFARKRQELEQEFHQLNQQRTQLLQQAQQISERLLQLQGAHAALGELLDEAQQALDQSAPSGE